MSVVGAIPSGHRRPGFGWEAGRGGPNWTCPSRRSSSGMETAPCSRDVLRADWNAYLGACGDLDGDGRQDLLITNEYGTTISFLSNGDRTFRRGTFHADWSPSSAVGDLNGDGKADLVLLGSSYLGNGDGTFGPAITYVADMGTPSPLVLADLNGDSKLDLVLTSYQRPVLSVYLGNGDGSFAPPIVYKDRLRGGLDRGRGPEPRREAGLSRRSIPGSNTVSVFMNHGDGSLVARVDYPSGGLGPYIVRVGRHGRRRDPRPWSSTTSRAARHPS